NNVAPKDRDIAMVFQNYALYPHMTVYKNMAFGLKLRKMPRQEIDQKVRKAAQILGIEQLLERKPKALSGGQRQRVAVGRAIVRDPACFLFDEPLSNLDAKLRVTTRAEIKRLHQSLKTTTIYVTHDQEEAMTLGDRIVVMKDGLIMQADTPLNTYQKPNNRFVAGFIGTPPMNFFNGVVRQIDGETVFEEAAFKAPAGTETEGEVFDGELIPAEDGFKVALPPELIELVQGRDSGHLVLGLRPEHIHLDPAPGTVPLEVNVNVIEPLGSDMDVYMSTRHTPKLIGRVEARQGLEAGSTMTVYVDLNRAHLFEPGETGMNLKMANQSAHRESHAVA
ncbi:MAG: ATP-binding cassette domain-containing protein, partial [Planctomycetota bacterium]